MEPVSNNSFSGAENAGSRILSLLRRNVWVSLFVVFPILVAVVYYGFVASDRYVSESRFVIKSPGQRPTASATLANLIQTSGMSPGRDEANEIIEYLRSRNALDDLNKRLPLKKIYGTTDADVLSRFPGALDSDTFEDLYEYYGNAVTPSVDHNSGIVALQVWAFSPKESRDVNAELLLLSERMVNLLNQRAEANAIEEAESRIVAAEGRLKKARLALRIYRNSQDIIDPVRQAAVGLESTNRLIIEQSVVKAQLEQVESAAPDNPAIPALRMKIAALERQINVQSGKIVGTPQAIASKLGEYESLVSEQEFAEQMLTAANAALEQARTDALKQKFYLERVVEPNLPDEPLLPNRLIKILTIAGLALCLYLIGWMLVVGIIEHSPDK
ncbi:MAG: capsule biosynthesis protein [Novosphingobium sp. 32-60-15]|uniref:Wzz/FepE/Etk N-terminal domain-containing protein n=1 Tax=unclassified Novosphingobium TaxID=2644732 RepID=UPI000BC43EF8|nr:MULTISPECIES: Wzz/FepE/Etk N-terminal domain-containing protein [unclassified Novosphingobium]OYX62028.1 MAG: capsule biosynthesis protein [Novosphingobium sp. 32-60-15]